MIESLKSAFELLVWYSLNEDMSSSSSDSLALSRSYERAYAFISPSEGSCKFLLEILDPLELIDWADYDCADAICSIVIGLSWSKCLPFGVWSSTLLSGL